MHELQFAIAVEDIETGEIFETCERDMAAGYLPVEVREYVMPCICESTKALVEAIQPQAIYRVTKAIRPPEKALHKHQLITDSLIDLGYAVTQEGTDAMARRFWLLER